MFCKTKQSKAINKNPSYYQRPQTSEVLFSLYVCAKCSLRDIRSHCALCSKKRCKAKIFIKEILVVRNMGYYDDRIKEIRNGTKL